MSRYKLEDLSPMPFGKHEGTPMQDVPVHYLHWLWCNGKNKEPHCPVHSYILINMDALQQENEDLIWD